MRGMGGTGEDWVGVWEIWEVKEASEVWKAGVDGIHGSCESFGRWRPKLHLEILENLTRVISSFKKINQDGCNFFFGPFFYK